MTTLTKNFPSVCAELERATGKRWKVALDKDMYCWDATEVLLSEDGQVRIIFDPPGQNFTVGVEWSDVYIAKGSDIMQMIAADPQLEAVLSGTLLPAHYFNQGRSDWRDTKPAPAKPHGRVLFELNILGLFTVVVKV